MFWFQHQQVTTVSLDDDPSVHNVFRNALSNRPSDQKAVAVVVNTGADGCQLLGVRHEDGSTTLLPVVGGIPIPVGASWDSLVIAGTTVTREVVLFF